MKLFNSGFRESLRGIRDIYAIVSYTSPEGTNILVTEANVNIDTENLFDIGTEKGAYEIENEAIYSAKLFYETTFFKTICIGLELECKFVIPEGTEINVMVGTTNSTSGEIEFIEQGYFVIYGQPEYNADSDTYSMVGYDHILDAMISFKDNPLGVTYPIKHRDLLEAIFNKLHWTYDLEHYANEDFMVEDLYSDYEDFTYRDVLDDLLIATGKNLMFNTRKVAKLRWLTDTEEVITDEDMNESNVTIGEVYGRINKLVSTTDDVVYTIGEDSQSIQEYGKTEYDIGQNLLIKSDTDGTMYSNIFSNIDNVYFHTFDVDTKGLLVFEPLDMITIEHNEVEYPIILLKDDMTIKAGLTETIIADKPEEDVETYISPTPTNKEIKNAVINVDRLKGQLVLKVDDDGKIAQVRLDANADSGTEVNIKADNIDFSSHTFNLDTDNISITSDNVIIDDEGIKLSNGAKIAGENGLLGLLQYNSDFKPVGFTLPMDYNWASWYTGIKTIASCMIEIPDNFVVKEARVIFVNACAQHFSYGSGGDNETTGYCRKIKAYIKTGNNIDGGKCYFNSGSSGYVEAVGNAMTGATLLTNFGNNDGYTLPSAKQSNYQFDRVVANIENPQNVFSSGQNYVFVTSGETTTSTTDDTYDMDAKTGIGQVMVEIIGWTPYTR